MKVVFELVVEDADLTAKLAKQKAAIKDALSEISKGVGAERYRELTEQVAGAKIEVNKLTQEQKALRKEFAATQVPKDSLAGLRLEYGRLTEQVTKLTKAERESEFGKGIIKNANAVKSQVNSIEESLGRFTGSVGNYRKAFTSIFDIASGVLIGQSIGNVVNFVTSTLNKGIDGLKDYGVALDRLSAITGVTGQQLEVFKQKAEGITAINVGGQEIVNTATDIFNAFTLVGSARPELLKDADALQEVTKQALILSKASGDDLDTSVRAITSSLAQFQLSASDSADVINLLAAGSKAGKVEIPGLADSITRLGPTAKNSNVSLSETVALFETLADKGLEGERASVQLRNVLINLSAADVLPKRAQRAFKEFGVDINVLKDKALPLEVRLKELGKVAGDTTALFEIFGKENIDAAAILSESLPKYLEIKEAVIGTDEAYKQAAINSDNFKTRIDNLSKQGLNILVNALQGALPALEGIGSGLGALLETFAKLPAFIAENSDGLIALGVAVLALNKNVLLLTTSQGRAAIATGISTAATEASTFATEALATAQAALPLLAVVAGIYLAVKAFEAYSESADATTKATRAVADAQGDIAKETAKEISTVRQNIAALKDDKVSKETRKKAIDALTASYPDYLKGLDLEKASIQQLAALEDQLTQSIIRSAAERKKQEALGKVTEKIVNEKLNQDRIRTQGLTTGEKATVAVSGVAAAALSLATGQKVKGPAEVAAQAQDLVIKQSEERLKGYQEELKQTEEQFDRAFGIGKDELVVQAPQKAGKVIKGIKEDLKDVNKGSNAADRKADKAPLKVKDETKSIEAQIGRINDLRKAIRDLDAQTIPNQFDQKEIELQSRRLDALATLEEKRIKLADKVKKQGGKQTQLDVTEAGLISEQTASTIAAFDQQAEELAKARQEAKDKQIEDTKKLYTEVEALAIENSNRLLELEVQGISEEAKAASTENQKVADEKKLSLQKELLAGTITKKEFQDKSLEAQIQFDEESLRIEKEKAEKSIALAITVKDARINAARAALAAELEVINANAKADIKTIKETGKDQGIDTTAQVAAREALALEQRTAAQQKFSDAVKSADDGATQAQIDGIMAVNDADQKLQDDKLARIEKEKEERKKLNDFILEQAGAIASAFFEIEKNSADRQKDKKLTALDDEYNKKKEAAQGNKELIEKLDKEQAIKKAAIEKQAARERKNIALKEAIVQGALGVIKALPNPFLAIAAAIAAAAQIVIISSQKFAKGGTVKRLRPGIIRETPNAPTTSEGDNVLAYLKPGEMVLNEEQQRKVKGIAGHDVFHRAGVPLGGSLSYKLTPGFAGGGYVTDFTPQIALPAKSAGQQTVIVQTVAQISDEQMDMFAKKVAAQSAVATKEGVGEGLSDNTRLQERQAALTRNREA